MTFLILGIALWYAAHLFKRVAPDARARMGDKGRGPVALVLLLSVVLMVLGYRSIDYIHVWAPAPTFTHINNLLVLVALYFVSPGPSKGALFYKMRHPMLTGFTIWGVAHLLVNGDLASVILFGSLTLWALMEMVVINRSEPEWTPNSKGTLAKDAMFLAISVLLVGVIGYIHTLFGLMPFGG